MSKKVIAVIGADFIKNQFSKAAKNIDFLDVIFLSKDEITGEKAEETTNFIKNNVSALMLSNITKDKEINHYFTRLKNEIKKIPIIPIGLDMMQEGFFNIDEGIATKIISYFTYGGLKNLTNVLYYVAYNFLEIPLKEKNQCEKCMCKPEPVPFDGIFHNDTDRVFKSLEGYANWYIKDGNIKDYKWIGILTHRHNWNNDNIKVEKELIKSFEYKGFKVIAAFSYSTAKEESGIKTFGGIIKDYFSIDGKLVIDGLVNFQMLAALGNGEGGDSFEQAVKIFKKMNVPVFRPIVTNYQNEKSWRKNISGASMEIPWSFTTPEMMGMIEPIIVGCRNKSRAIIPIKERINKFVGRVSKWVELRNTENKHKKLAIFLHNAPCSGVEATVGLGAGLDVFESVVNILKELKKNGYNVENIPQNGEELHKMIMDKKAYQDFRWTSVEDIIEAGGVIYKMPLEGKGGYLQFYNDLDKKVIEEIEETWGTPPGEGMVYENKMIITGINFGNVTVMVQPKRGCYGAKCTGEVCKILHDPKCPPPHQYIGTYKYVEKILKANAVVHVGTHGSLEYLPGKTNALSNTCYPDIVLGTTPNMYVYNAGISTDGILAKRRSNAVIIDYLPNCTGTVIENSKVVNLIGEYIEAETVNSSQKELLKEKLIGKIKEIDGADEIVNSKENFIEGVEKLKDYLVQAVSNSKTGTVHVLGEVPGFEEAVSFIKEYIQNNSKNAILIKKLCENDYVYNVTIMELIAEYIKIGEDIQSGDSTKIDEELYEKYKHIEKTVLDNLKDEILNIYDKLKLVKFETRNLIKGLNGSFVEPGLSGMPCDDLGNILPTGRNFYLMDCEKIPTKEAYKIGCKLADGIIEKYMEEEGRIPEKIAMNMISTDISMAKGEQLSQMLYLMGITPIWDQSGKVVDLEAIPLEKLKRPRIDVIVRISGVLRDAYPNVINLMDKGTVIASSLEEPFESNFVRKNTFEIARVLKELGENEDIERRSTMRVFGDKPGTYGSGVNLALMASAWKDEKDIGKIFVYFSSHAYGENLNGRMAKHEFVENIKASEISYDNTISNRYDVLSSGFAASVQGGFRAVKKLLSGKEMKQYHGGTENKDNIRICTLKEEIKKTMEETFFNPLWKENVKKNRYTGASEFMRRIQSVFDWQCLSQNIDDKDIDKLVDLYVNDEEMVKWFGKHNKYAVEEIGRRFLELYERKKWNPNKEILDKLRKNYIKIEGDMEELSENSKGEIQGGDIEVLNYEDIESWNDKLKDVDDIF